MTRLFLVGLAVWVAYFLGRGHEYAAWTAACETPDDTDWLRGDTYQDALLRTAMREAR